MNTLHSAIMDIPCKRADSEFTDVHLRILYKEGHCDARHAAAELSLPYEPPVMESMHIHNMYLCLRKYNSSIPSETLIELRDFLLKFAKENK